MSKGRSILIVGTGDLGLRIALRSATTPGVSRILLAGRDPDRGRMSARFVAACAEAAEVSYLCADALDTASVATMLREFAPDALIQCASMHSPWLLQETGGACSQTLLRAGFASQLSAQLPIAHSVLSAARDACFDGLVVNCSYPDVVNPILSAIGLAPTCGIGNAGMIHALARAALHARGDRRTLRTLAHHAHVTMTATLRFPEKPDACLPRFFLGDEERPAAEIFAGATPIASTRDLNEITAAHALAILAAFLGIAPPLRTSAPGVGGLPGGWPVRVSADNIELDLPLGMSVNEAIQFNARAARLDGIESIDANGIVRFGENVHETLMSRWPILAEPMSPFEAQARYRHLRAAIDGSEARA